MAKLCCAALVLPLLISCGGEKQEAETIIRPVRYQPVYATGGTRVRKFSGVARAGVESNLSFKVTGTVRRLAVKVGDDVTPGQAIADLDPADYELQVQRAQASLDQAQAQERNSRTAYERVRGLYENMNASKNDLDQARAAAESAEAQATAAEKALELARLQLEYTHLKSPVAGSIAAVPIEVNEHVMPGKTVAVVTSGSRMEVEVGVPEILIAQIREGDRVTTTFDALPGKELRARVTEVGVASTGVVTTFPVTVALDSDQPEIRAGMAAEVAFSFRSGDQRERFIVPPVAVGEDRQGRYVFVAEPTEEGLGEVSRRPVTIGELTDQGLEVFEGLFEGDLLITAGVSKITEGQTVRLEGAREATQ
jgi:RND family efflux transporter MFP subunit